VVVTDTGLASGYQAVAKEEKSAKRIWRGVTVAAMLLLIGFAGFIAYESYTKEFNLATYSAKLFGALSVGTLVAFAARQASLHGQAERANKRMELQLKAIGPYLVGFKDEEILEIKRLLVDKFFGREEASPLKEELPNGSMDAIRVALETVQQVVKGRG
jgi:4-amino-4-deoxy-L-arabinose transferase-like glycosyltransferase